MAKKGLLATPIVNEKRFIVATRDTGYRSTGAAIAELVDNAIQAGASIIRVFVDQRGVGSERQLSVAVLDNGSGMNAHTLAIAMQFAGSSRFNDRSGLGRFGMGLPNSSVSQSRRVDVYTWQRKARILHTYLDVDEIAEGLMRRVPVPRQKKIPSWAGKYVRKHSGTLVQWTRCDRLDNRRATTIAEKLHHSLGRRFRNFLWQNNRILVNDTPVTPFDPLYLSVRDGQSPARTFGDVLTFEFRIPSESSRTSTVRVRFSELPVAEWSALPVDAKRELGILKGAGVSVVRADREIDYGWYLMGRKRKENYDDWWRCEISFDPALDELFGVTHSKQEINPSVLLRAELSPHLEAIAQTLNSRVRAAFVLLRKQEEGAHSPAESVAARCEPYLPPIRQSENGHRSIGKGKVAKKKVGSSGKSSLEYRIRTLPLDAPEAFTWDMNERGILTVTVNQNHCFYDRIFSELKKSQPAQHGIECLLLAFARAVLSLPPGRARKGLLDFSRSFSNILAAYLGD